jgi:hypothetical protein
LFCILNARIVWPDEKQLVTAFRTTSDIHDKGVIMNTVQQNRITRKKLRKQIKNQAAKRVENKERSDLIITQLSAKVAALSSRNADCAKLLDLAIRQILEVVNCGEFSKHTAVTFDLGFVKITYVNGKFSSPVISIPSNELLADLLKR